MRSFAGWRACPRGSARREPVRLSSPPSSFAYGPKPPDCGLRRGRSPSPRERVRSSSRRVVRRSDERGPSARPGRRSVERGRSDCSARRADERGRSDCSLRRADGRGLSLRSVRRVDERGPSPRSVRRVDERGPSPRSVRRVDERGPSPLSVRRVEERGASRPSARRAPPRPASDRSRRSPPLSSRRPRVPPPAARVRPAAPPDLPVDARPPSLPARPVPRPPASLRDRPPEPPVAGPPRALPRSLPPREFRGSGTASSPDRVAERTYPTARDRCRRRGPRKQRWRPRTGAISKNPGDDLLSQGVSPQVPSALAVFTSVFGMGTGVSPPLSPPETNQIVRVPLEHSIASTNSKEDQRSQALGRLVPVG
jgi:hypothetical protein